MARPIDTETHEPMEPSTTERDERIGEAIEDYLSLVESGSAPDPEDFASRYPDLKDDLKSALDGLAMVQGLVGDSGVGAGGRLEAGRRVAGYRIVRELGRGGMGIVYEAVHVDLDRPVALKVLGMHAAPDSSGRRRFLNEAKTAAGLHHTHIVPVFDVGQVGGLCYYAMQRIEGCGLDRVLKALRKGGRQTGSGSSSSRAKPILTAEVAATVDLMNASGLGDPTRSWFAASAVRRSGGAVPHDERSDETPPYIPPTGSEYYRWVARLGQQAADALSHAHRRGVIHRDIKPSNLLVDGRGVIWVADFGLARRISDPSMTQTESLIGTPRYMSPEQALQAPIDVLTDVYSLGATLYELLTLRPPHDGTTTAELIGQIRDKEPVSPRKLDPKLPRDLETIVLKAMGKRPSDRYASAGDLAEDLDRFLAMEPVKARRIGPLGRAWRFARRHPSLTTVSTVATVTILATAIIAYVQVVQERNKAVNALAGEKTARKELNTALIQSLLRDARNIRQSHVPDVRRKGLERLQEAVERKPSDAMKADLRNEAVQLLALRDIEPKPSLNTGLTSRLAFLGTSGRLATLTEGGAELDLWDLGARERVVRHALNSDSGDEPRDNRPGGGMRGRMPGYSPMSVIGTHVAVIRPAGKGVRILETSGQKTDAPLDFIDLPMNGRSVNGVLLLADGQRLVTIETFSSPPQSPAIRTPQATNFRVNLWDTSRKDAPLALLSENEASTPVPPLRFPIFAASPDGKTIALGWWGDEEIHFLSAEDGRALGSIKAESQPTALALSSDGTVAAACSGTLFRWDLVSKKPLPGLSLHQMVQRLRFSPDGDLLAAWGGGSGVEIWSPEANTLVGSIPTNGQINDLAFSPDSRMMAASVGSPPGSPSGNSTRIWALVEPIGRSRLAAPESKTPSGLMGLSFAPSGSLGATFRSLDGKVTARLQCSGGSSVARDGLNTSAFGFDPEGRLIVPNGQKLEFYSGPRELKPASSLIIPDPPDFSNGYFSLRDRSQVLTCLTSADGQTMAMARIFDMVIVRFQSDDSPPTLTSVVRNAPRDDHRVGGNRGGPRPGGVGTGPSLGVPDGPPSPPPSGGGPGMNRSRGGFDEWSPKAISPTGDRLYFVFGRERELRVSLIEDEYLRDLKLRDAPRRVSRVAASPDGLYLAIGHEPGGEVSIVSTKDASLVGSIPAISDTENDPVTALAFSRQGQLGIGTKSGTIRLWTVLNPEKPVEVVALPNLSGEVKALAYSTAGGSRKLAVGGDFGADIWDLDQVRVRLGEIGLGW